MKIYVSGSIYGGTQKIDTYKIIINELEKSSRYIKWVDVCKEGEL